MPFLKVLSHPGTFISKKVPAKRSINLNFGFSGAGNGTDLFRLQKNHTQKHKVDLIHGFN